MVAHPVPAITRTCTGKDVKTRLKPVIPSLSNLNGFMHGMIRWADAIHYTFFAFSGPIGMEFHHGAVGLDRVSTINLDFIIVLRHQASRAQTCHRKSKQNRFRKHCTIRESNRRLVIDFCGGKLKPAALSSEYGAELRNPSRNKEGRPVAAPFIPFLPASFV